MSITWPDLIFPPINLWNVPNMKPIDQFEEEDQHFKFFSHTECNYWPCHGDVNQNCLFCYCPLAFLMFTFNYEIIEYPIGVFRKDWSMCTVTHDAETGWDTVQEWLEYPRMWDGEECKI